MKILITALVTILLCACGSESASIPEASQAQKKGPVVFMGDSLLATWDSVPSDPNDYLTALVPDSINVAIPGQTTDQMLARFETDVIARHPSVVVILGGSNDLIFQAHPSVDSIASMAKMATDSGARVVLGTVPPSHLWIYSSIITPSNNDSAIEQFNQALEALAAAKDYALADYYDAMVLPDGTQNSSLFQANQHPNSDGFSVMWDVLKSVLPDNVI